MRVAISPWILSWYTSSNERLFTSRSRKRMANQYDRITPSLQRFIQAQPLFFVATAPLSEQGHVNLSPKGYDTFRILSPHQVAYLDLTGSGNETSAHLAENGRITFMFCAFHGVPKYCDSMERERPYCQEQRAGMNWWPISQAIRGYVKLPWPRLIWY